MHYIFVTLKISLSLSRGNQKELCPVHISIDNFCFVTIIIEIMKNDLPGFEKEKIFEEIAQAILAHLDLNRVFRAVLEKAMRFFNSDAASLMLFDESREFLTIVASAGLDPDYVKIVKVKKDEEIAGRVIQEKKVRVVNDVAEVFLEIGDTYSYEKIKNEGLVSLICAPIVSQSEYLGVLNIYFRRQQDLSEDEIANISFFCNLIAIAIENARYYKETSERLQSIVELNELGLSITSLRTVDEIAQTVIKYSVKLVGGHASGVIVFKSNSSEIDQAYFYDRKGKEIYIDNDLANRVKGFIDYVVINQKPLFISDVTEGDFLNSNKLPADWRSIFCLPIKLKDKIIGILLLSETRPRIITEREKILLNFLANESAVAIENAVLYENIEQRMKEMSILYEVSQSLISTLELDALFANTLLKLKETMGYVNCAILFVDEVKQELYFRSSIGYPEEVTRMRLKIGQGLTGWAVKERKIVYVPDVTKDHRYVLGMKETKSELAIPLEFKGRIIGVLDVESPKIDGFSQWEIKLMESISSQLAMAIYNSSLFEEVRALSLTDPLTEIANRRHFDILLDSELRRSERYGRPLSIIMLDLDHFKEYNDLNGHIAGDQVLKEFAKIMKGEIREIDFIARYGGDEFVVILPETDNLFAKLVAERIRQKIETNSIDPSVTVSLGIASFPRDARNKEGLIQAADRSLYAAKQLGGNRIALAE